LQCTLDIELNSFNLAELNERYGKKLGCRNGSYASSLIAPVDRFE